MQQPSLTLPNAPAERPTGRPMSINRAAPRLRAAPAQSFPQRTKRGEPFTCERVLLGAFHLQPGLELATAEEFGTGFGGCCTVRHGDARTKAKSYQIRHRPTSGAQTVPRLPALARLVPFLPSPLAVSSDNTPPGELIDQIRLGAGTFISQPCHTDNTIPAHGQPATNLCSSWG